MDSRLNGLKAADLCKRLCVRLDNLRDGLNGLKAAYLCKDRPVLNFLMFTLLSQWPKSGLDCAM